MNQTPVRTSLAHRVIRRPHARRVAGGLLAGVAGVAGIATAAVVLPGSEPRTPEGVTTQSLAHPAVGTAPSVRPAAQPVRRASRGGARTVLPPVRYVTKSVPSGASFSGEASWYGPGFQGKETANGERFDTNDMTAASKTLPLGSRLQVCRQGKCVIVRVNDRGPYVGGRILDLSKAAKTSLGYDGVGFVTATPVETKRVAVRG